MEVTLIAQLNLLIFQWPVDIKIMSNIRVLKSTAKERRQVSNKLPIYWVKDSTALQSLTFFKKRTSVSLSVRTVSVPVNSPGFCHRKVKINFCVKKNCGFFLFEHHKIFGSWYAKKGTHRHRETLTRGIHGVLLRRWCCSNVFVIDGCGIKQWSVWKYTADLL